MNTPTTKTQVGEKIGADTAKIGFAKAMSKKWIKISPENKEVVERIAEKLEDNEKDQLKKYAENPDVEVHDKKVID